MVRILHRFEWDEKTLSYKRVSLSPWKLLRSIPKAFFWGAVAGAVSLAPTYSLWEAHYTRLIEKQIQRTQQDAQAIRNSIYALEKRRQSLYERMQKFYRPLLGMAPLPPSVWEGGMGGSPTTPEEIGLYRSHRLLSEYRVIERQFSEVNERLNRMPCLYPVRGPIVSDYGYRNDPFHGAWQMHTGVDIDAPMGAPVKAAAAGKVIYAGWDKGGYGIQVEIDHLNGIVTKYAHLSSTAVNVGDMVPRGHIIGYVGSTGYSTGPHLHYEVIERGAKVDPRKYLLLE
ncbi:MAG: M23 family metallopeptidase [Bacteroidia bacterium]|nr:M23 family metallopeptidase [Bacteroidia bacterium]MCX7651331.1 M23 family metallopeptidase [Bacteroidia bacterium]MDW8417149.1 M23 family metallopeptidase [Bacteroidia bacterium]